MAKHDPRDSEAGFTLIELMVVVLIIGILIAIALPTYLGARTRAEDRAAQTNLRTSLAAAMTHWASEGVYDGFDVAAAEVAEPSVDWRGPGQPGGGEVSIEVALAQDLLLVTRSRSTTFFCIQQTQNSPVYAKGHGTYAAVSAPGGCTGGW